MSGCLHPRCHGSTGRGRILCTAHWLQLPVNLKAKVRDHLRRHNYDSVRVILNDFYTALYSMKERLDGNDDPS